MNEGAPLDQVVQSVRAPAELLAKPYLRPIYDEPEFIVRNLWRLYGGWYDGDPSHLKPAPARELAASSPRWPAAPSRPGRARARAGRGRRAAAGRATWPSWPRRRTRSLEAAQEARAEVNERRAAERGLDDGARGLLVGGRRGTPRAGDGRRVSAARIAAACGAVALVALATHRIRTGRGGRAALGLLRRGAARPSTPRTRPRRCRTATGAVGGRRRRARRLDLPVHGRDGVPRDRDPAA